MGKWKLDTQDVVDLYLKHGLSAAEIGTLRGTSRGAVWKRLRRASVPLRSGTVKLQCSYCGTELTRFRTRAEATVRHFCNAECYYASLASSGYKGQWRQGSRLARAIVAQHFDLQPDHVVHHEDGDNHNNDRANLVAFTDQAAHMAHHRGRKVAPLWRGSECGCSSCAPGKCRST